MFIVEEVFISNGIAKPVKHSQFQALEQAEAFFGQQDCTSAYHYFVLFDGSNPRLDHIAIKTLDYVNQRTS